MATKIEILAIDPRSVRLALYYVPSPLANADDQARTPAGTRLSIAEQQALKDGTLYELVRSLTIAGMSKAAARTAIEAYHKKHEAEALREYAAAYRDKEFIGMAFDGASWS